MTEETSYPRYSGEVSQTPPTPILAPKHTLGPTPEEPQTPDMAPDGHPQRVL